MATRQASATKTTARRRTTKSKVTKKSVSFSLEEDQGLLSAIEITLDEGEFDSFNALCREALNQFLFAEEGEADQPILDPATFNPEVMGAAIAKALQPNLPQPVPQPTIDTAGLGEAIAQRLTTALTTTLTTRLTSQLAETLVPRLEEAQPTINIDLDPAEIGTEVAQALLPTLQHSQEKTIADAVHDAVGEEAIQGEVTRDTRAIATVTPSVGPNWEQASGEIIAGVAAQVDARLREKDAILATLLNEVRSLPALIQEIKVPPALEAPAADETAMIVDKLDAIEAAISQDIAVPVVPPEPEEESEWSNEQNIDRLAAFLEQF